MALDQKFFKKSTTGSGLTDQEEGLVLHLDANDVDSYDGDGYVWYDITKHEVNIPLVDKGTDLVLHLNSSDTASYPGYGTTWTDLSTYGNDAVKVDSPTYGADTRGYFDLDGSNDRFLISNDSSMFMTSNTGFTIELWVNRDSNAEMYFIAPRDNSNYPYALQWHNNHGYYGWISGSTASGAVGLGDTSSNGVGEWDHVVLTQSSSDRKNRLYVNGTLVGTSAAVTGFHSSSADINIGAYSQDNVLVDGKIGVVRVYKTELTAAEIGQNFRAGNFLNYSSIITSKHQATQGSLITTPPVQGTLHTSNLQIDLDANSYSGSGNWLDGANDYDASISAATYVNNDNSDYFDFAGSTNNPVSISYNSILNAAARTWEFWVWFDTDAMNFFGGMWGNQSDNSTKTVLFRMKDGNNAIRAQVYEGAGGSAVEPTTANNVVKTNEWNHIVFTSDNSDNSFKIYVNGVEKYSTTLSFDINTSSTENFIIGAGGGYSSNRLNGRVAQFRYYNAALTSAQVNTNYNATKDLYQGATSLKLHLDANEYSGSGDWQDSANNNDGVINGATYTNDNNSDYFDFDGNDTITVAGSDLNPANTRAIELWFNADITSGATSRYMISNWSGSGNNYGYHIYIYNNTLRAFMLDQSQSAYFINFQSGGTVTVGKWHHAVLTIGPNASDNKLYLDGELKQTASSTSGTFPTTAAHNGIIIGAYGSSGYYDGKIAQVRAYKGTLTQAQINTNYNATKALYQNPTLEMNLDVSAYSGSGNLLDTAGSHDATITNATYDEELGNFFTFDGTGDYLTVAHDNKFNFDASCTFEMWIWRSANTNEQVLMHKGGPWNAYNGWFLNWTSSVGYYFYDYDTASLTKSGTTAAPLNQWHHFVLAYNSTTRKAKMYINGIEPVYNTNPTDGGNAAGATNTGTLEIGKAATSLGTGHPAWNGRIGDVKFYSGEMTQAQAAQNYLATKNNYPNGFNLNIYNGPVFSNANKEFSLNGSNQYFYNSGYPFDFGVNDYTVIIWFNSDTNNQNKALFSLYNTQGLMIDLRSDGTIRHYHDASGSSLQYYTSETVTIGTWYQLAVTLNRANNLASMFLSTKSTFDSTASTSSIGSTATRSGNGGTNIGRYNSGFYFDGKIANVRVYQKALSSSEIEAVWNTDKNNIP